MSAELQLCPLCSFPARPQVTRGGHSGKYFLLSTQGCEHVWKVVNYQNAAPSEQEAIDRWNAWVAAQPPAAPAEKPSEQQTP